MVNSQSLDQMLRAAISRKRLLRVRYDGKVRDVEPHDYGVQKSIERLLAYQLRSTLSVPGRGEAGWRLLALSKIESCEVLDESFAGSRGHQHTSHRDWDVLYARVT